MSASGLRWAVNCTAWAPTKQEWLCALSAVQREEVERVNRFVFRRDAKMALAGRLLMRAALVEALQVSNREVVLQRTEKGKPILAAAEFRERVSFNISHQGDYAVLVSEDGRPVGVDVMQFTRPRGQNVREFFHTMRRQFTAREWEQIQGPQSETEQLHNFYRFWCLKESFIKAEGSGLSYGLKNLEFVVDPASLWPPPPQETIVNSCLYIDGKQAEQWDFHETLMGSDHCVAVALHRPSSNSTTPLPMATRPFSQVSVEQLLSKLCPVEREARRGELLETHWDLYLSKHTQ